MAANNIKANYGKMQGKSINEVVNLDSDYSFKTGKAFGTTKCTNKHRAQMFYKGVPVYGQSVVLEQDGAGRNIGLQGSLLTDIAKDLASVSPAMLHGKALGKLKQLLGHNNIHNSKTDLVIHQDRDGKARLAYKVEYLVDAGDEPSRPMAFVDADTGEIIVSWDAIAHKGKPGGGGGSTTATTVNGPGGNIKTGEYFYGTDFGSLIATTNGSACYLDSPNVTTVNMGNSTRRGSLSQVNCGDTGEDFTNWAYAPMNDAQAFGNVIFDMYGQWYGTTPLSQKLEMRVH